ncbi:hypothetical protein T265_07045 [Opisthorchis viverrini]|uniref:Reverse transcriptase domain-containing protein n=1 Tax=Opisthorchis viverrini TaxID=6198 RepID=A0A075ACM4_OPIVI|nr:hypothetical protein T265_07045 [Opisthorchis viverrini]KER25529.1 hypothetical protein T265_07045 [Opisthorchis viverrini]
MIAPENIDDRETRAISGIVDGGRWLVVNTTLKKLQETHEITRQERWKMKADDTNIAQFYGLPKVHKEGTPLRPIVSLPGTPTYKLAKDLWRRLKHLISGSEHTVNNAGQFLHKLRNVSIEDDEVMLSFDVTSLFTSINHNLARTTIAELLQTKPNTTGTMKPESIGKLLDFCMDTYFTFDGQIYQQLKGTPMGSPISGFIAEAVMQRLEHAVLPIINPKLWIRYVDDTFVIVKRDSVHEAHELLNTTFEDIKFTIELERNNRLPFLDVLVNRKMDGTLETCVYRKETHTDQILNYNSNHPVNHKKSCVQTLFKRAETHCSTTELRKKEENHLLRVFQNNGYPRNFIKRSLKKKTPQPRQQQEQATRRVVLPYIRNISELATRLLAQKGIFVAHKPNATLRKLISRPKDNPDKTKKNSVIYQLNCDNCIKFYVGQTGRRLCTRIKEHNAAVRRHDPLSLISIHEDQEGHKFNLENAEILTTENEPDVVFLGDSILLHMQFSQVYKTYIVPLHCVNFSVYHDETQHVLWRIENGELDGFSPKVIVIMVGTHNVSHTPEEVVRGILAVVEKAREKQPQAAMIVMESTVLILILHLRTTTSPKVIVIMVGTHNVSHTPEEVVRGILAVVEKAREKQPQAAMIVMGLLPCGRDPNPRRTKHEQINKLLAAELSQRPQVTFLSPDWEQFVQPNGTISHRDMFDYLHPAENGYNKLAEPLIDELQNLLQTFLKTDAPSNSAVVEES